MLVKRVLAVVLAIIVIAGVLSGCGGSTSEKSSEAITSQASTSKTATNSEEIQMIGNMYIKGLPLVKEKETLRIIAVTQTYSGIYGDMQVFKDLEAKTNVHVEWELIPNTSWEQKKNVILASGNLPDAFFDTFSMTDVVKYGPSGTFIKLNELIDEYGDNVKREFSKNAGVKRSCTFPDGSIYSLPAGQEDPQNASPDSMFIYKPWLDKLGLQVPTTIDEFYQVLKAFKDKDPNENGKSDEIPFSCIYNDSTAGIGSLYGAFGRVDAMTQFASLEPAILNHFIIESDNMEKIIFTADKDEFKNAIIFFNKCFKEELFDKEMFTQQRPQYFAKGKAEVPIIGSFILWNNINMTIPERVKDYVPVPALKGSTGKQVWRDMTKVSNSGLNGGGFVITNQCKIPEVAFKWGDQFFDKETSIRMAIMVVNKKADGTFEYAPVPEGLGWDEYRYQNLPVFAPGVVTMEDWGKIIPFNPTAVNKINIINTYYKPYMTNFSLSDMLFTQEDEQYFATKGMDIQEYVDSTVAKWNLQGGIESEWDNYKNKLKELGLDEYLNILQTAYERYLAQGK